MWIGNIQICVQKLSLDFKPEGKVNVSSRVSLTMSNRGPKLQTQAIRSSFVVVLLFAFGIFFSNIHFWR